MTDMTPEARREIEELLPFLANGTLEGDERAMVEAAVAADESLAWELDYLKAVREQVKSREVANSPGEFGLARLMKEIDTEAAGSGGAASPEVVRPRVWQWAAAAAVALLVAQTALVWGPGGDPGLELAGGGGGAADGPVLIVAFSDGASESAIRQLLLSQGLEMVGGPSALGLYRVAATDEAAADAALAALRAAGGIVDSAERE